MLILKTSRGANGAARQAATLRQEGVVVSRGSLGEHSVDFGTFGWFPFILPSEAAEIAAETDEDSE